jgi:hypothetical protein
MPPAPRRAIALMLAALAVVPRLAAAQSTADTWEFGAAVYGWFPTLAGNTAFPSGPGGGDITVDARQVLDSLEFGVMGALEARRGRWGIVTDLLYMSAGAGVDRTRDLAVGGRPLPADATARLRLDVRSVIWTTAGTYRLDTAPGVEVDVLAGARLLDMRQTLAWQFSGNLAGLPLAGPGGSADVDIRHWDGVVGAKGRFDLGGAWFVPFHADVGAGDSDLTWQGLAGIGYRLASGQLIAAWRHLEYRPKDGEAFDKVSFDGPSIGFVMRW